MSYYANGNGTLDMTGKAPEELCIMLSQDFEVASSPDGGLWLTFEYGAYDDDSMRKTMRKLAPHVKKGNVEFSGDDGSKWRFHFWNGNVRYEVGRTVYEPEDRDELHSERMELVGILADTVEDWLESKGITAEDIPCEDRDQAIEDGEDPEGLAIIYGEDYDELTGQFERTLINFGLIMKEEK